MRLTGRISMTLMLAAAAALCGLSLSARAEEDSNSVQLAVFEQGTQSNSDNPIQLASCSSCSNDVQPSCADDCDGGCSAACRHLCDECQAPRPRVCEPSCASASECPTCQPSCACAGGCTACECSSGPSGGEYECYGRPDFRSCSPLCDRWYVSVSGGWQQRSTVHEENDRETFIVFNDGFAANAALGVHICRAWRLEVESTFMNNTVDQAGAGGLSSPSAGNVNLHAYMLNLYRDFHCCNCPWVSPYVGAGIGIYQSELNGLNPQFFDQLGAPFEHTPINATSDMPLAYQFRAGVSCPLTGRADFFAGYRYFKGQELTFAAAPFASFSPTFHPDGAVINSVEMGIRVNF